MLDVTAWEALLIAVQKRINHESYNTWFRPLSFDRFEGSAIRIQVPDQVFEDWILNNYRDVLDDSMEEIALTGYEIRFEVCARPASAGSQPGMPSPGAQRPAPPMTDNRAATQLTPPILCR